MKYAFLVMGDYQSNVDRANIRQGTTQIIGVSSIEEACAVACALQEQGIDCIELCGAFGEEGAKQVIQATGNQIPIGYVIHLAEQDALFQAVFGG